MKIGFIGLGNMATAMISGMLSKKIVLPGELIGSARTEATRNKVKNDLGISVTAENQKVAAESDLLFLAVKPQFLEGVLEEIKDFTAADTLVVSIAAGKTLEWLEKTLGGEHKIIRCMPNTPALVGEGCTGVCCNSRVEKKELEQIIKLLQSFGRADLVTEAMMDAVVAVSGSSPAYVFLLIEAMGDGAVKAGMPRAQAYEFAAQAVLGSAKMVLETGRHPAELKDMVCSPAGTTIEAVKVLEEKGFKAAVMDAMDACVRRNQQL